MTYRSERRRPVIGVTGPDRGGAAAWLFTWLAVTLAGGTAVRITPSRARRVTGLAGLIVGGGADVDPRLYGQSEAPQQPLRMPEKLPHQPWRRYLVGYLLFPLTFLLRKLAGKFGSSYRDDRRDALELRLIEQAMRRGLPVLGICRGEQLLNIYFGGSLHQDVTGFYVEDPEVRTILPRKTVRMTPGTHLGALLGPERRVNALHHQAIDRLGHGLRAAARDRNGLVQAIEHESLHFVVGVQWHPEFLLQLPRQRAIFQALVDAARRGSAADDDVRRSGRRPRSTAPPPGCGASESQRVDQSDVALACRNARILRSSSPVRLARERMWCMTSVHWAPL
jgi:putative glutamine amidotransferase